MLQFYPSKTTKIHWYCYTVPMYVKHNGEQFIYSKCIGNIEIHCILIASYPYFSHEQQ